MTAPQMPARILVIDDDRSIRGLIELLLHRGGMDVDCAENGGDALELLRRHDYDAVLLDLMMPGMNGFDFLETVRLERPQMIGKTIVVTAFSRKGTPPGVDGTFAIIRKPFDIENLMNVVDVCLESKVKG